MLAKRPADRPQTPGEVVELLAPWGLNPVAPPTDDEVPAVAGGSPNCPGTVNLSGPRSVRAGGALGAVRRW